MLPDWLCTGGGGSGDQEFCKPDTWRKTVKSLRNLKGKKVGRFAGPRGIPQDEAESYQGS